VKVKGWYSNIYWDEMKFVKCAVVIWKRAVLKSIFMKMLCGVEVSMIGPGI